jgi:hypothetical protein
MDIRKSAVANLWLAVATILMLMSAVWDSITLVNGDYRRVLWEALVCIVVAEIICIFQFFARRGLARWWSALIALSSIFVVSDVLRRLSR